MVVCRLTAGDGGPKRRAVLVLSRWGGMYRGGLGHTSVVGATVGDSAAGGCG